MATSTRDPLDGLVRQGSSLSSTTRTASATRCARGRGSGRPAARPEQSRRLYRAGGRCGRGTRPVRRAAACLDRILGPEHPATLATRNDLAGWTGQAGDAAGARGGQAGCPGILPWRQRDSFEEERSRPLPRRSPWPCSFALPGSPGRSASAPLWSVASRSPGAALTIRPGPAESAAGRAGFPVSLTTVDVFMALLAFLGSYRFAVFGGRERTCLVCGHGLGLDV
jgi:hypothetical protein